jgi:protein farnesyltransferase subunit beta
MLRAYSSPKSPCFVAPKEDQKKMGKELDLRGLMRWATSVQAMPIEGGGFRGRTNKLVDGCYSWWCGGLFAVLGGLIAEEEGEERATRDVYDRRESARPS